MDVPPGVAGEGGAPPPPPHTRRQKRRSEARVRRMPASKGAAGFCWQAVERALERARGANALRDIPTVPRRHGKFVLRLSENLRQKPKLEEASGVGPISRPKRPDPFERNNLDPDLVVCDLGSGHTVLLNKFPVVSPHLLVVTRDFEYVFRVS